MMRVTWIDNTKGIAIFLVVLGHFYGLESNFKNFIYSFHLPVFLLISGFLVKGKLSRMTLSKLFSKQLNSLIKLYFIFSVLSIVIFITIELFKGNNIDFLGLVRGTLYGVHGSESLLKHGNGALWYFPFFISSVLLFYCLLRLPRAIGWTIGVSLALFSVLYEEVRLPWAIDMAGVGVLFLLIGGELNIFYERIKVIFSSKLSLYSVPLIIITLFYLTTINGKTNINTAIFGESVFLYFLNALLGCWFVIIISHHIKQFRLIELFSVHSLIIFSLHLYLVKSLRVVTLINNDILRLLVIAVLSFLITYICMHLSRLIMPFLDKYVLSKSKEKE